MLFLHWFNALSMPFHRCVVFGAVLMLLVAAPAHTEPSGTQPSGIIEQAMRTTVGILSETPAERESGFRGRLSVRGSGVHLRDGYVMTARHAVERDQGSQKVLPKDIFVMTHDLAELPAHLVGGSAYLDIVLYRISESHRNQLPPAAPSGLIQLVTPRISHSDPWKPAKPCTM